MTAIRRWLDESPGLRLAVWVHLGLLWFALVALPFDQRQILGLNPWIKPLKFDLSVLTYLLTTACILAGLERWRRSRLAIGWGIGVAMMVEDSIISMQSLRGVRSHMNYATAFDATAFSIMGVFIALNTLLVVWMLVLVCTERTRWPKTVAWGFRLGLLALVAGSAEGTRMVMRGGHTVGAADGLPGLWLLNWSTSHGDLRVAHFFAIHALQAMPLLGWALLRTGWRAGAQIAVLGLGFVVYMGAVWWLFAQAMAGVPVAH